MASKSKSAKASSVQDLALSMDSIRDGRPVLNGIHAYGDLEL